MNSLIDEKWLLEQTDDNKEKIINKIKEQIAKNKKRFPDWRKRPTLLRTDLPKPFLYGKETFQIKKVSEFARTGKNLQLGRVTGAKKIREALLRAMTDQTGAARKTAYGRGARKLFRNQEDHHIIFRTLLDKFYKDLPEDQAAELTAHLARRGSPTGNVIENLQGLDIDLHDSKMPGSLHQWARNVGIDSKSFPDLSNLDFDTRTVALDEWLDLIEQPLLDRTATVLSRQDYRRYGTKGLPKKFVDRPGDITKKDWLEFLTNQRENVKARANLLDKYPILAEDLDSPNIRPELKARYEKALSLVPEKDLNQWKKLTNLQEQQKISWINDPDIRKTLGKPTAEVTEVGRRLGGIGDTLKISKSTKPTIKPKGFNLSKFGKTLAIGTAVAGSTSLIGGEQGHAAGMYAKTGEGKYLRDLSIAAGRDLTVGYGLTTGLSIAGKAAAKGALTKGLVRSAALRTLGGAVAGPLGIPLMIYGAYDTANQFTKAYTGRSINERIKNKAVSLYKNTLKNKEDTLKITKPKELLISDSRADLKKHGILTNYQGGNDAMDATIDAIIKDPEMKESWGLKSHLFMDRA